MTNEKRPKTPEELVPPEGISSTLETRFCYVAGLLHEWAHLYWLRKDVGSEYYNPKNPENKVQPPIRLRKLTFVLLDHFYHEAEPGERRKPDREFWSLFPESIPLGHGEYVTKQGLADKLIKIFRSRIGLPSLTSQGVEG